MKCPICVREKKRSRLYPGTGSTTLLNVDSYYDEDGKWHYHDPNWSAMPYRCSDGHRFTVRSRDGCKACRTKREESIEEHGAEKPPQTYVFSFEGGTTTVAGCGQVVTTNAVRVDEP